MTAPAGTPAREATLAEALREWARILVVAVVAWLLIRTFLVEAFRIPSSSMERTLLPGDRLFVNKAVFGPEVPGLGRRFPSWREPAHGDILVFDSVEEDIKVVKRLIGLPGDTLEMRGGLLYRNGLAVAEPYAQPHDQGRTELPDARLRMRQWQLPHLLGDTAGYAPDLGFWGPLVVPPDSLFLLGDNRDQSYDSRYWGFVARRAVRGTPLFIYYSYDPASWQRLRGFTTVRWERLFSRPR